jgi:hypothetical protein
MAYFPQVDSFVFSTASILFYFILLQHFLTASGIHNMKGMLPKI